MGMSYTDCDTAKREHEWYRWQWSSKRSRYERECSTMGCNAWEYLKGSVVASGPIVSVASGQEHVHEWKPWYPIEEFWVVDNRCFGRDCKECTAQEQTGGLTAIGETVPFPWQETR